MLLLMLHLPTATAEEDPFTRIDQLLDNNFESIDQSLEEQFEQIDQAMEDAYRRLGEEIEATWGEDEVLLPSKTAWVDYTDDMKTRRVMDFANGTLTIERVIATSDEIDKVLADLQKAAATASTDTESDLAARDHAMNWARKALARDGIDLPAPAHRPGTPVLKGVADAPRRREVSEVVRAAIAARKNRISFRVPFRTDYYSTLAQRYLSEIRDQAEREGVTPSLLLAVMETESSFNPRATSPIPAYGLMQLVPGSGAMDAYEYVYGEKTLLGPDYLYEPGRNVELGSAYLGLLQSRYLRHIRNPENRQLCAIAAYNTGAGNVARSFVGTNNVQQAAEIINGMTPDEVYNHLISKLPYEETRNYLRKVTAARKKYLAYDGNSI